jgi:hypothetical protein
MWLSIRPGSSTLDWRLSFTVTSRPEHQGVMSSRLPTTMMRPSLTATQVASGNDSSMVWMRRAGNRVSGGREAAAEVAEGMDAPVRGPAGGAGGSRG